MKQSKALAAASQALTDLSRSVLSAQRSLRIHNIPYPPYGEAYAEVAVEIANRANLLESSHRQQVMYTGNKVAAACSQGLSVQPERDDLPFRLVDIIACFSDHPNHRKHVGAALFNFSEGIFDGYGANRYPEGIKDMSDVDPVKGRRSHFRLCAEPTAVADALGITIDLCGIELLSNRSARRRFTEFRIKKFKENLIELGRTRRVLDGRTLVITIPPCGGPGSCQEFLTAINPKVTVIAPGYGGGHNTRGCGGESALKTLSGFRPYAPRTSRALMAYDAVG